MHHPWSKMSEEEFNRRKGVMQMVFFAGGAVVLVLFAVQVKVSLGQDHGESDGPTFAAGAAFLEVIAEESQKPLAEIGELTEVAAQMMSDEIMRTEAQEAVINKLKSELETGEGSSDAEDALKEEVATPDSATDRNDEPQPEDDQPATEEGTEGTWLYDEEIEETQ